LKKNTDVSKATVAPPHITEKIVNLLIYHITQLHIPEVPRLCTLRVSFHLLQGLTTVLFPLEFAINFPYVYDVYQFVHASPISSLIITFRILNRINSQFQLFSVTALKVTPKRNGSKLLLSWNYWRNTTGSLNMRGNVDLCCSI